MNWFVLILGIIVGYLLGKLGQKHRHKWEYDESRTHRECLTCGEQQVLYDGAFGAIWEIYERGEIDG